MKTSQPTKKQFLHRANLADIKISDKYLPVLLVWALWLIVAIPYTLRTPDDAFTHDFGAHVQYTQLLHQLDHFPRPGEGAETHQPPLYYLMASQLGWASSHHVLYVRLFSIFLGALVLLFLNAILHQFNFGILSRTLSLLFLATTPHFLFIFSTYNNDALVTFCGIGLWAIFLCFVKDPSFKNAAGLAFATLAGFFTKFSFGVVWISIGVATLYLKRRRELSASAFLRCVAALGIAMPVVLTWMYLHNFQNSGHWLALNTLNVPLQRLPHSALETILTPPGFTSWEWITPFTDHFLPVGKKNSLTAYLLASSVFGEHPFQQLKDFWIWLIFWVHTLWLFAGLMQVRKSRWLTLMGITLGVGWLAVAGYVASQPFGSMMDFRHVAWLWAPLIVLETQALEYPPAWLGPWGKKSILAMIFLGILTQWALILAL